MGFIGFFDLLLAIAGHNDVEVLFGSFVRNAVDQDDWSDVDAADFSGK